VLYSSVLYNLEEEAEEDSEFDFEEGSEDEI
jgi:hypothetical protein